MDHTAMLAAMSYPPSGALFERNPVCGVCWRVCMQMCEDRGGCLNFDLLRSMEQADRLCARLVADTWSLCGIEHYYHWLEAQLSYSRPAVACATATVCLTLALMEQVPEPLRKLSRDMRGLLYGEAGELYDTMRTTACRQDIPLSATTYGAPPAITPQQALINTLLNEKQQLKNQLQAMSKTPRHQTTVYNYGTYNDIHDNPHATIYATAPQDKQPDSILPPENDYTALVRWLEFEKLRGNDYYAEADCNRTKLCRNLLKIIGWEPNQDSLRKAQNR